MKSPLSSFKMIFDPEHRAYTVAAFTLTAVLAFSFIISATRIVPSEELDRMIAQGKVDQVIALGEGYLKTRHGDVDLIKSLSDAYLIKAANPSERSMWVRKSRLIITRSAGNVDDDPELLRLLGYGLTLIRNYESAEVLLQKAATLEPKNALIWVNLGQVSEGKGNLSGATALYDKALRIDPNLDEAIQSKVSMDIRQALFKDAIKLAEDHLKDAKSAYAKSLLYESLGLAHFALNEDIEAINSFKFALSINPNLPYSLGAYAGTLLKGVSPGAKNITEMTAESLALATRAYKIDPAYPFTLAALSDIAKLRGDKKEADKYAKLVIKSLSGSILTQTQKRVYATRYGSRATSATK